MPPRTSLRIGFLVDSLVSPYQLRLFTGVQRVARRNRSRVIGFQGSYLTKADAERPAFNGSFLYDLASPQCVDGLIVASNILAGGFGTDAVRAFCERSALPVVSIGTLRAFPHVDVDNRPGLRSLIKHLVEVHGRRRFAFIRGNAGNPDSVERERIFRDTLHELGIPIVEGCVLPGNFLEASGATAVRVLDERRLLQSIDAIVAANDQMAVGAAHELSARGLRVPRDIAIVGFDDDDHARNNNPPLTTVAQPVERLGECAAELLLERISGRKVAHCTLMEAEPVWRFSCGCGSGMPRALPATPKLRAPFSMTSCGLASGRYGSRVGQLESSAAPSLSSRLQSRRGACLLELERLLGRAADPRGVDALLRLLGAESEEAAALARDELEQAILSTGEQGLDPLRWQEVFTPLEALWTEWPNRELIQIEASQLRMFDAHLLVKEVAARTRTLERLHTMQRAAAVRVLGNALVCVRSLSMLASVLDAGLANLGVSYCCVCLFTPGSDRQSANVAALYAPVGPPSGELLQSAEQLWCALPTSLPSHPPPREFSAFPAEELVPFAAAPDASKRALLVYPLVFGEAALGYVVFDAPRQLQGEWLLEALAGHLSSAVYSLSRAEELRRAREVAEKASAAKSEFVAVISHEVRTPLTAIIGHVDLCLQTSLSRSQRGHLSRARTSSRALLGILNDILDFSKIEARKLELEAVPFQLDDVLEELSGTYAAAAARKGLEFVIDVDPACPSCLTGDSLRLTQVLLNLVGNAIKFSAHGHVLLSVDVVESSAQERVILFTVSDTGIGLDEEQVVRIFDPFTQADSSTTRRYGGTGLGLAVSRRLVGLLGGELRVESEPGSGSTFSFKARFGGSVQQRASALDGAGSRILLLEDSALQARAAERLLLSQGYEVVWVRDASSALRALAENEAGYEFVIVDYELSDAQGLALVRQLSAARAEGGTLLILLSAPTADSLRPTGAIMEGIAAVVTKPVLRETLLSALARARSQRISSLPPSVEEETSARQPLRGRCVLLVQDEEVSLELSRELLLRAGAWVKTASDGQEAVSLCTKQAFDLVLMDINLPVMDGCAAARAIHADPRSARVPIVAMTASARAEDRARCLEAGMNGYLCTPLEPGELLRTALWYAGSRNGSHRSGEFAARPELGSAPHASRASARDPAVLDSPRALLRIAGDAALYRRLLRRFVTANERVALNVQQALRDNRVDEAALILHTVSAAAANIGAGRLQGVALAFYTAVRRSDRDESIACLAEFELAAAATLDAVAEYLQSRSEGSMPKLAMQKMGLADTLTRLHALLAEHDTAAVDCLQLLRELLGQDVPVLTGPLDRLAASVSAYDFEQARNNLETVSRWLATSTAELPSAE